MNPAWRVDIQQRDRKQELPAQGAETSNSLSEQADATTTEHMVGLVDRVEQRVEMPSRPEFFGRGDKHERERGPFQSASHRLGATAPGLDDHDFGFAASFGEHRRDPLGDLSGFHRIFARNRDDANSGSW